MVLAGVVLAGCSGSSDPDAAPTAPPSTTSPQTPTAQPSPEPTGPDRSPEALAGLLDFTAPEFDEPVVSEAVDGYEEYLRQFVVATGLAQPDYPPLLAAIEPSYVASALDNLTTDSANGFYFVGPYVEEVVDAAGNEGEVFITTCVDVSAREVYTVADDTFVQLSDGVLTPVTVTMRRGAQQWVLADYRRNEELTCA